MKLSQALLIGIASALVTTALLRTANFAGSSELRLASQPAYDRVMQSHTLRCGYMSMKPYFVTVDTDHSMRRGLAHDIVEQMGRILNLKIEWTDEIALDQISNGLASGKEDAMCFPLWPNGENAASLDFTVPIDFMPIFAVVRSDDTRFDGNLVKINDSEVKVSILEGGTAKKIVFEDFPQASLYSVSVEPDELHMLLAVSTKKADVAFIDPFNGTNFMRDNPNTLKYVTNIQPVRVFPESFAVAKGEEKLRDMMNVALTQMQQSGFIKATLDKYLGEHKGEYYYQARSWDP